MPDDQADIGASLASAVAASATGRPEIQLFAAGSPDTLNRTVDVASLSSWLAVRAIDRETRRLDSIERGDPPPAAAPPSAAAPKAKNTAPRPPPAPPPPHPRANAPSVTHQMTHLP